MSKKTPFSPPPSKISGLYAVIPVLFAVIAFLSPSRVYSQSARRVTAGLLTSYIALDKDYFGMDSAIGADFFFRYEIFGNVFVENRLGAFSSDDDGYGVGMFNGQIGVTFISTHFLPYRPYGRAAFCLLSANPLTATPTDTFRPSQTNLYFVLGLGVNTFVWKGIAAEAGVDVMFTPYEYIVYTFDRQSVGSEAVQFTHFGFSLGASYSF